MAYFNEFPHTRSYDSDLAWLIDRMKELMKKMDRVDELLAEVQRLIDELPEVIRQRIQQIFNELVENGYFLTLIEELLPPLVEPFMGAFQPLVKTYESSALGNISAIPREITNISSATFEVFENPVIVKLKVTAKCSPESVSGLTLTNNGAIDCRIANSAADVAKLTSIPIRDPDGISNIFQRQLGWYGLFRNAFFTDTLQNGKEYVTTLRLMPVGNYTAGTQLKMGSSLQVGGNYGSLDFETYYVKDTQ